MLDRLTKYREFILLSEILALLHDLGKVNDRCNKTYPFKNHLEVLYSEMGFGDEYLGVPDCFEMTYICAKRLASFRKFVHISWSDIKKEWEERNIPFPESYVKLAEEGLDEKIGFTALRHHENVKYKTFKKLPATLLQYIISQADTIDAIEDRIREKADKKDKIQTAFTCNSYGKTVIREYSKNHRLNFYRKWPNMPDGIGEMLDCVLTNRKKIMESASVEWKYAPAMTPYPDNDTSVWDHCFSTAAIAKAILAGVLLEDESMVIFERLLVHFKGKINKPYYLITFNSMFSADELDKLLLAKAFEKETIVSAGEHTFSYEFFSLFEHCPKYVASYHGYSQEYRNYAVIKVKYHGKKLDVHGLKKYLNEILFGYVIDPEKASVIPIKTNYWTNNLNFFYVNTTGSKQTCLLDSIIGLPNVLSIQYPGRDYRTLVYRTQDFLGRDKVLLSAIEDVQHYIEETLGIGNLVYQDVNGIYFMVPALNNVAECESEVTSNIIGIFNKNMDGDIIPLVRFAPCKLTAGTLNFGETIVELKNSYETNYKKRLPNYYLTGGSKLPEWIVRWNGKSGNEICHICGKRPVESANNRYQNEKICAWCDSIRGKQPDDQSKAIFLDQIRDENNKLALLVGEFGLFDKWLSGNYVMTNVLPRKLGKSKNKKTFDENEYVFIPKRPSPSRLRRVIGSLVNFYDSLTEQLEQVNSLQNYSVKIYFKLNSGIANIEKGFYSMAISREIVVEAIRDISKTGSDYELSKKDRYFINQVLATSNSLGIYVHSKNEQDSSFSSELIVRVPSMFNSEKYAQEWVLSILENILKKVNGLTPDRLNKFILLDIKDMQITIGTKKYHAYRDVYSIADEFMWLVPANQAGNILKIFEDTFSRHFDKARGRLSLSIGTIFFDHKYPLYLIFDGGQRMLKEFREFAGRKNEEKAKYTFEVNKKVSVNGRGYPAEVINNYWIGNKLYLRLKFKEGMFAGCEREYIYDCEEEQDDGKKVKDIWFTNFLLLSDETSLLGKVVDCSKLKPGDHILFTPNIFDFQQITSAEDRLCIALPDGGDDYSKRENPTCNQFATRPMLMEDLWKQHGVFAGTLQEQKIATSALHNFQEQMIHFAKTLDHDDYESKDFLKQYCEMLLGNISNLNSVSLEGLDMMNFITDGSFFDLMELMVKHQVFDQQTSGGEGNGERANS